MKLKILYVGLSVMVIGVIVTAFGYSDFSRIAALIQAYEMAVEIYKTLLPSYYQQMLQSTVYQQYLANYNTDLIIMIGGVALLLVGLGVTIYGATKKDSLPTSTTETPENKPLQT